MIFKGCNCHVKKVFFTVNNVSLMNTDKAFHPGHSCSTDDNDSIINGAIAQFWRSFNLFSADFGHILPYLQCNLFEQYCCRFYGTPLLLLSSHIVNKACTEWRKVL